MLLNPHNVALGGFSMISSFETHQYRWPLGGEETMMVNYILEILLFFFAQRPISLKILFFNL